MNRFDADRLSREEAEEAMLSSAPAAKSELKQANKNSLGALRGWMFDMGRARLQNIIVFMVYLVFLALLNIGNTYRAEKYIRQIDKLTKEMKELRYEYITTKSELMFKSKASEVATQLAPFGIKESIIPPHKIELAPADKAEQPK